MEVILSVLGGLVLFLFAVSNLSQVITGIAGENTQKWLLKFTRNTISAVLTGAIVTTVLDSSSAVIIITIVLVNSGLMSFRQAMGIVLGANIGTTVSSQIIAMDIGKFSPIFLVIGFVLLMVSKTEKITGLGKVIVYFGMLFFGLYTMERAVEPLRSETYFLDLMTRLNNQYLGIGAGALITLIIQSSSAAVGMAIVLAKKGLLTSKAGIAIMMGSELGTCADTLLATVGSSINAKRTGYFHLIFNVLSIFVGMILFVPFHRFVEWVSSTNHVETIVANAHMMFNALGVIIFVWFTPLFEELLNKWVK